MSPREIAYRIKERARKSLAKGRMEGWERYGSPGALPRLSGLLDNLRQASPSVKQEIAAASHDVMSGRFSALGAQWPERDPDNLFPPHLWRLDPLTGGLWPGADTYCFDIAYRHERQRGDIKYVWEFNRLQFLQPLAADVALTGNRQALGAIEAAVESWFSVNPPFRGVSWTSGIELALRAISLLVVTSLCGEVLRPSTIATIRTILHAHMVWLARYPSRFSSANNHRIAELAGELLIALALPDLPFSATIEAKTRRGLAEEADRQILADGASAEQSPSYGAFTAELLLLCSLAAKAGGGALAPSIDVRLAAFAGHIAWLSNAQGQIPCIGDDDEGRVLTLGRPEPAYAASVSAAICGFHGAPLAGLRALKVDLRDALFHAPSTPSAAPLGLKTFPDGGYTVLRQRRLGRDLSIVFDHGHLGYLSIAAHGHADALSIAVDLDGAPLFVDPGTYLYHSGAAWRSWFRGTRAHNTLTIGGANQSTISGPFNWSHKAVARLEAATGGTDWTMTASHDGYRSRFGVVHRRTVSATDTGFAVHDQLTGLGGRDAEIVFQTAPDCFATKDGQTVVIMRNGRTLARLSFSVPGAIAISTGGDQEGGGWVSPCFGVKIAAPRIQWRGHVPASGVVSTVSIEPLP